MRFNLNAILGWGLAMLAVALGHTLYGWHGVLLALTMVVFWLLLQFTQALRAMRQAGQAPVGQVPSAVMLQARLHPGMRLLQIIQLSRSLGRPVSALPEVWAWQDDSGAEVRVLLRKGRLSQSSLHRPEPMHELPAATPAITPTPPSAA